MQEDNRNKIRPKRPPQRKSWGSLQLKAAVTARACASLLLQSTGAADYGELGWGCCLVVFSEGGGLKDFDCIDSNECALSGPWDDSLGLDAFALEVGVMVGLVVLFHSLQEELVAAAFPDVFNAHMQTFYNLSVTDNLLHLNANSSGRYVEDNAGPSVIKGIRHTLLNRGVTDDINKITLLEVHQIPGNGGHTVHTECLGVFLARTRALSKRVRHFRSCSRFFFRDIDGGLPEAAKMQPRRTLAADSRRDLALRTTTDPPQRRFIRPPEMLQNSQNPTPRPLPRLLQPPPPLRGGKCGA